MQIMNQIISRSKRDSLGRSNKNKNYHAAIVASDKGFCQASYANLLKSVRCGRLTDCYKILDDTGFGAIANFIIQDLQRAGGYHE